MNLPSRTVSTRPADRRMRRCCRCPDCRCSRVASWTPLGDDSPLWCSGYSCDLTHGQSDRYDANNQYYNIKINRPTENQGIRKHRHRQASKREWNKHTHTHTHSTTQTQKMYHPMDIFTALSTEITTHTSASISHNQKLVTTITARVQRPAA